MNDRRQIAIHEAGHAVIGRVLTMVCGGASIVPGESSAGHSITADPYDVLIAWEEREKWRGNDSGLRSVLLGRIMTLMAGAEAEIAILGQCEGGDGDDRYWISVALENIESDVRQPVVESRLRRATKNLIYRHRTNIDRVAEALLKRETLTGPDIDEMLPPGFMARPVTWVLASK